MKKILLVLIMGLMVYAGWKYAGRIPAEQREKLNTALSLAEEYESKGYYKDANLEYEKALRIEESSDVRRRIVMNLYRMEDFKSFKREAESYLKKNPDEEIYTYLIADYLESSDRAAASKYLDKAEKEFPESEPLAELRSNLNGQFTLSYTDYSDVGEYMDGYVVAKIQGDNTDIATETDAAANADIATKTDAAANADSVTKTDVVANTDVVTKIDSASEAADAETVLLSQKGKVAVNETFETICDVKGKDAASSGLMDSSEKSAAESVLVSGIISGENKVASLDEEGSRRAVESEGYDFLGVVHDGWILAERDGKWGYLASSDGEGKNDTGFIYEDASVYDNGVATVKLNGKWAVIGSDGKQITDYIYDDIYMDELKNSSRGGVIFAKKSGEEDYSIIGLKGNDLTAEKYTVVKGFLGENGVAAVEKNGKWGAVDTKGKEALACKYEETGSSETKYIPFKKEGKWGYISPSGKELIEPQFEDMRAVNPDGYGFVKDRGTWELITVYSIRGEESLFD